MTRKHTLILAILSLAACAVTLLYSQSVYRAGFPLDDAWIHQTYARSLAEGRGWEYIPGIPSAGSTSPLWSLLLSVGQLFRLNPLGWAVSLGWLTLLGLGLTGEWLAGRALVGYSPRFPLAGGLLVLEWHLVWAALSGMETMLSALVFTAVLGALLEKQPRWIILGLLTGLAVWIRPDGISLIGPVLFTAMLGESGWRAKVAAVGRTAAGVILPLVGYLALNMRLAGTLWPNTFYAKGAEYAVLQEIPYLSRLLNELSLPLVGVGLVLLPGAVWFAWMKVRDRAWGAIAGIIWWLGYAGLYAWYLPVTYQHGRYMMPAMPIFFLWGCLGLLDLLSRMRGRKSARLFGAAWAMLTVALLAGFLLVGADAYARDVAVIESEIVDPARWIANNTEPDALIAAHDIGALGYFGERRILDLAGLISPEVIPVMGDPDGLRAMLDSAGANYLLLGLGWYGELGSGREVVYRSTEPFAPSLGMENSVIVRWEAK